MCNGGLYQKIENSTQKRRGRGGGGAGPQRRSVGTVRYVQHLIFVFDFVKF